MSYPAYASPKLIDLELLKIQRKLEALSWLTVYGRSRKMVDGNIIYPAVYIGHTKYKSLLPDKSNYSFFVVDDPQEYEFNPNMKGTLTIKLNLLVWFNISQVESLDERNTEMVKEELLNILKSSNFEISRIYENADNIFKGFTLKEVESQYMMYPYAGFRFEGTLRIKPTC